MTAIKNARRFLRKVNFWNLAVYAVLILISYQFLYPLIRMITTSLMSSSDIINPAVNWIPRAWSFGNLRIAFNVLGIFNPFFDAEGNLNNALFNSLWWSGSLALGQTLVSSMTGYAFARFNFKFKRFWFVMVIVSFIMPTPIILIPRLMMFQTVQQMFEFQLIGTAIPQWALAVTGQGIFSAILILIFYNFTRLIPRALDEAAAIDGANSFQIFYHVILKLSITTLLVVFLFSFVWNWNETYITSTLMRDRIPTMTNNLSRFESLFSQYAPNIPSGYGGGAAGMNPEANRINEAYKMSGTFISIIPLFIIYMLVQRQFIKGIENAGITGE